MNAKRLLIGLIAVLLALLMIVALTELRRREQSIQNSSGGNNQTAQTTPLATDPTVPTTEPGPATVPAYSVCISTAYGDLYYQDQWMDFMVVEQTPGTDVLTVTFRAKIQDQTFDLFSLIIGQMEGSPVGQITDASGVKRDVHAQLHDLGDISRLTAGEQNRLYAMQEEINFVIETLR